MAKLFGNRPPVTCTQCLSKDQALIEKDAAIQKLADNYISAVRGRMDMREAVVKLRGQVKALQRFVAIVDVASKHRYTGTQPEHVEEALHKIHAEFNGA